MKCCFAGCPFNSTFYGCIRNVPHIIETLWAVFVLEMGIIHGVR
jgi:hypothetical protein